MPRHQAESTSKPAPGNSTRTSVDGELALGAFKAGRDGVDQPRRGEHAREHEHGDDEREHRRHRARHAPRLFFLTAREKVGVDRNEGRREHAFAEEVLQEIGNAEGGVESVRRIRAQAEVVREDAQAHQAHETAEQDARRHQQGMPARARVAFSHL